MVSKNLSNFEVTREGGLVKRISESLRTEIASINKSLKYAGLFLCVVYVLTRGLSIGWELGNLNAQKTKMDAIILAESNIKRYYELPIFYKLFEWEKYVTNQGFLMISDGLDESIWRK